MLTLGFNDGWPDGDLLRLGTGLQWQFTGGPNAETRFQGRLSRRSKS